MKFKIKIKPKLTYYFSILASSIILFYFAYKGVVAYLIHRELYGGGLDTLVLLRASISGIMLLLILLFIQFRRSNQGSKKYTYRKRNLPSTTTCKKKVNLS